MIVDARKDPSRRRILFLKLLNFRQLFPTRLWKTLRLPFEEKKRKLRNFPSVLINSNGCAVFWEYFYDLTVFTSRLTKMLHLFSSKCQMWGLAGFISQILSIPSICLFPRDCKRKMETNEDQGTQGGGGEREDGTCVVVFYTSRTRCLYLIHDPLPHSQHLLKHHNILTLPTLLSSASLLFPVSLLLARKF